MAPRPTAGFATSATKSRARKRRIAFLPKPAYRRRRLAAYRSHSGYIGRLNVLAGLCKLQPNKSSLVVVGSQLVCMQAEFVSQPGGAMMGANCGSCDGDIRISDLSTLLCATAARHISKGLTHLKAMGTAEAATLLNKQNKSPPKLVQHLLASNSSGRL